MNIGDRVVFYPMETAPDRNGGWGCDGDTRPYSATIVDIDRQLPPGCVIRFSEEDGSCARFVEWANRNNTRRDGKLWVRQSDVIIYGAHLTEDYSLRDYLNENHRVAPKHETANKGSAHRR